MCETTGSSGHNRSIRLNHSGTPAPAASRATGDLRYEGAAKLGFNWRPLSPDGICDRAAGVS